MMTGFALVVWMIMGAMSLFFFMATSFITKIGRVLSIITLIGIYWFFLNFMLAVLVVLGGWLLYAVWWWNNE